MSRTKSKHNILAPIDGSTNWLLANPLWGNADILSDREARAFSSGEFEDEEALTTRGYLTSPSEESQRYKEEYLVFLEARDRDEIQLFYAPTYGCNFACDYCYQEQYSTSASNLSNHVLDALFAHVDREFKERTKYFTLFGGEPLLKGDSSFAHIEYFLNQAKQRNLDTAVVTNGYHLDVYMNLLVSSRIREVQVTLDGMASTHNRRRPLKGGGNTFEKIVQGINQLLDNHIPVNLRMVLDKDNINQLPLLADFAIAQGWTKSPLFKTQLGRNYELHHCYAKDTALYSRTAMYADVANLIAEHPHILEFHKPSFHFVRHLAQNGAMPTPVFDACPGGKTEWAFDYSGNIYSCTATVGKKGESLGTFYPTVDFNQTEIAKWQDRDVLAIDECKDCNVQLICGGGCGAVAKNKNGGLHCPDCRPVSDLAALGMGIYFDNNGDPLVKKEN